MVKTVQTKAEDNAPSLPPATLRDNSDLRYGWGSCKPDGVQWANGVRWFVLWLSVFSFLQGFVVNGCINAVLTSLETRFELASSQSGLIPSSNNFISMFAVLLVTHYGSRRNKPRLIAAGILLVTLGSFIFSSPHFFVDRYNYQSSEVEAENACYRGANSSDQCWGSGGDGGSGDGGQSLLFVFLLANALHGLGATPIFTLGVAYIDENSRAERTSWYLGIIYAAAALGVAAGYMGGAQVLNLYTDIDRVDMATVDITPLDPRWVGAWWIPFLGAGFFLLLLVLPVAAYPIRLPGSDKLMAARRSEAHRLTKAPASDKFSWSAFPVTLLSLLQNPPFVLLSVATLAEGNIVSGIGAFGVKFMQEKFNLPPPFAAFIMGLVTMPGAGGGMLLGGLLVRRLRLRVRGMMLLNVVVGCLALLAGPVFLMHCPSQPAAGVNVDYHRQAVPVADPSLTSQCNLGCGCTTESYEPVCGVDGLIYFSPCHAGCSENFTWASGPLGPFKMYQHCGCVADNLARHGDNDTDTLTTSTAIPAPTTTTTTPANASGNGNATEGSPWAHQGTCMSDCRLHYVAAPILFVGIFLTFITVSPTQTATMRCVPESDKSLAIGFQWLFLRLGGTLPGPIILGSIIDSACLVWQEACGARGTCWLYARYHMGHRILVWWLTVKALSILCSFLARRLYRPPLGEEEGEGGSKGQAQPTEDSDNLDLSGLRVWSDRESDV